MKNLKIFSEPAFMKKWIKMIKEVFIIFCENLGSIKINLLILNKKKNK